MNEKIRRINPKRNAKLNTIEVIVYKFVGTRTPELLIYFKVPL
jgi:hypothetical protein